MAKLKKDSEPYITIHEDDYKTLLQDTQSSENSGYRENQTLQEYRQHSPR